MALSLTKGIALITGASSGIGAVYADRLASRGYDLILVARNAERLHTLAQKLHAKTGRNVTPFVADLSQSDNLAKVEELLRSNDDITLLVNNAGIGAVTSVLESNVDEMEAMIKINITALTRLTYAVAPRFAAIHSGTIINIGSIVAVAAEVLNPVYSASKSYVLAFGHRLQKDLGKSNVRIQTVLPGATATEFWDIAGYSAQKDSEITMTVDHLVDAALVGLDQGEKVTIPSLGNEKLWDQWEADRLILSAEMGSPLPAPRYGILGK